MEKHRQSGFTLIELLVAMVVAAILLGVGVPSFIDVMKNARTSTTYNGLISSLYLARSEAVKSNLDVAVCARASDATCGTQWDNGWLVFIDSDSDGTVDTGEEILQIHPAPESDTEIAAYGSANGTSSDASSRNFIHFRPTGKTFWQNGYFEVCDERGGLYSRAINIVLTGDVRRARAAQPSGVPLDVFGTQISCT